MKATEKKGYNHVVLQPEDAQRMNRLREEVVGRLMEMRMIHARAVGNESDDLRGVVVHLGKIVGGSVEFMIAGGSQSDADIEHHPRVLQPDGCYDHLKGVCCAGPCPC
jgi:hypothetical protein